MALNRAVGPAFGTPFLGAPVAPAVIAAPVPVTAMPESTATTVVNSPGPLGIQASPSMGVTSVSHEPGVGTTVVHSKA